MQEPGHTAGPSAALGMTSEGGDFYRGPSGGMDRKKQQVPPLRFAPVPRQAGAGGMTSL